MHFTIRQARPNEKDAVLRVYYAGWRAAYKDLIPKDALTDQAIRPHIALNPERSWVAVVDEAIVGTVQFGPNPEDPDGVAEIRTLYLLQEYWGTGIGKKLMQFARSWLASRGYTRAYLWMFTENKRAAGFYQRLGFSDTGESETYTIGERRYEGSKWEAPLQPVPPHHTGPHPFWADPHISESMLRAHLDPETDRASRKPATIRRTVRWLAEQYPAVKSVLDLGCGPGLYTNEWQQAGLQVTGIDLSSRSITYAQAQNPYVDYRVGNYLDLVEENAYDLITLIYFDYGVLSPKDRAILIQRIYRALKPGGAFVLDVLHQNYRLHFFEGVQTPDMGDFFTKDKHTVSKTSLYYPETKNLLEQYDIRTDTETKSWYVWNTLFTQKSIRTELAPFSEVEYFADLTGTPYDTDGTDFAVIAQKR